MRPPRRILIGAASYADARAALRLARQLAVTLQAEVRGLLVEEAILSDLPRLARQRVVTASGALHDVPTARQAARMIEHDAKAFQSGLAELSATARPLERRRGDLTVAMWEDAREWDVVVYGLREFHGLGGRIVLIAPAAGTARDAADLAEDLAWAAGTTAIALGLATCSDTGADETFPDAAALLARISRLNCAAVVLDRAAGPIRSVDQLRALLAAAHCPVVLVGQPTGAVALPE
ncbi:MAG TPA: hypothetical protein DIU07_00030 [Rhodobacteraceae bacterium]|nr:hypothetical protein [Paracoccaceae bacterium]